MTTIQKYNLNWLAFGAIVGIAVAGLLAANHAPVAKAATNLAGVNGGSTPSSVYQLDTFFTATTTTATSTPKIVAGAKRITFNFTHGGTATTSTGYATFKALVSIDGINYIDFTPVYGADVAATATTSVTMVGATSTLMFSLDLQKNTIYTVNCAVTEGLTGGTGVQGEHTCTALIQY